MKIYLVRPNYDSHLITPPLGLGYISSYLKKYGYGPKIIDGLNEGLTNKEIAEKCEDADVVAICCLSDFFNEVIDLSRKFKENNKIVIIGGPHATALPNTTLNETKADYVIIGEGEETMLELIKSLEQKKSVTQIKGLFTKDTKKPVFRDFIENLDSLPFPDWEQMDPRKYKKAPHGALIKNFPVAPIISTRGCPYSCTFCASPKLWNRKIRFRSPKNIISEIKYLINHFGVKEIHFEDDNLTLRRDHIEKICNLMIKEKLNISWACPNGVRADTLDGDLVNLMKRAGCYYLAFGLESGNQKILDNVKKQTTLEKFRDAVILAEKKGIMTQGFFIFGLPGETRQTIDKTIDFAKKIPLSRAQFLLLDVLPGSQLWDDLDYQNKVDWKKSSYHEITWLPPTIDEKTLNEAPSRAFRSFFFRPKPLYSLVKYFRFSQLPFLLKRVSDFKIFGGK